MYESFKLWIEHLSDDNVLFLVSEIWGEHHFDLSNKDYLKLCFKNSKKVYEYYQTYILLGD